jgi:hypothetical protein
VGYVLLWKVSFQDPVDRLPVRSHKEGMPDDAARQSRQFRSNQVSVDGRSRSRLERYRGGEGDSARRSRGVVATKVDQAQTLRPYDLAP